MAYSNRHSNNKKYWVIILIIILGVSAPIIYNAYSNNDNNDDNKEKSNFISSIIKPKEEEPKVESLVVGLDDYMEMPTINYELYKKTPKVKGVYVNAPAVSSKERFNTLIDLANNTEVNAFVIDVKDDTGRVTYDMDITEVDEIKAEYRYIKDINGVLDRLYDNDIYPIARIVAFKDEWSSKKIPDYAIKNKDGSLWMYGGISWLNPYNKAAWDYIINIAKNAAEAGFKEIQFDYIRFEATRKLQNADFGPNTEDKTRMDIIAEFVEYAMKELEPYNVKVSADVFGIIIRSKVDARVIGQDYLKMAEKLDVICPMIYPSHYDKGYFGIPKDKHADLYPYETILGALSDSNEKYEELGGKKGAIVRPWLQAFTASYLDKVYKSKGNYRVYGGEEIRAQVQAVYDAGLEEWILWNAGSKYKEDGLMKEE